MTHRQTIQIAFDMDALERELMLDGTARAGIEGAAQAVLSELGLCDRRDVRRRQVLSRMATSWQAGRRLPLHLVSAGLDIVG
jgi:hypothetical protein